MTPEEILKTVKDFATTEGLRQADIVHMQRYFLTLYTRLIQTEIAELTNCERSTICNSVRKMKMIEYDKCRKRIDAALKPSLFGERGYYWVVNASPFINSQERNEFMEGNKDFIL